MGREVSLMIIGQLYVSLFIYFCMFSWRLTKAQKANLLSWWRYLGLSNKGSQSWLILQGRTGMWKRSCSRWLRILTVEQLCNKVEKKDDEEWDRFSLEERWHKQRQWGRKKWVMETDIKCVLITCLSLFLLLPRYLIHCEILQYNTEYQRHCYSW